MLFMNLRGFGLGGLLVDLVPSFPFRFSGVETLDLEGLLFMLS